MERLNVEQLKIRQQKVENAIGNLEVAKEYIGTLAIPRYQVLESGTAGEVDVVLSKVRSAEIRRKITEKSIPILESIRLEVEEEIGKSLGIDRLRLSIPKIEALAAGGYLPQTDLKEAQELLARLEETVKTPLVKEAGVQTPPVEADLKRKRYSEAHASLEVEVFGQILHVRGKLQAEALKALNGTSEEKPIESDEVAGILYGENNQEARRNASTTLSRLNKILSGQGVEVVTMVKPQERAKGAQAKYFLRKITEEGEKQVSAETEKLPQIVVDLERNIVIVDGKEQKLTGKIKKAVLLFLTSRVRKSVHNKRIERVAVGAGSKSRVPGGNAIAGLRKLLEVDPTNPKILISVGRGRNTFYVLKADIAIIEKAPVESSAELSTTEARPEADAEIATSGSLTDQEAAILAIALSVNGALIKDFGFEPLPPEVASALWKKVQGSFSVDKGHLREERLAVLEKVRTLIETDEVYKLIDLHTKETEALLSFLTQANASRLLGFIRELIEYPEDAEWTTEMIRRGWYYDNWNGNSGSRPGVKPPVAEKTREPKAVRVVVEPQAAPEVQKTEVAVPGTGAMSVEEVEKLEAAVNALLDEEEAQQTPASVVQIKPEEAPESKVEKKPKQLSIEKRDPNVRETISQIVDEIELKGIKKPLNADQLTNYYSGLKMTFLKHAREERYIKPETGRDKNHPAYSIKGIAMLVYVYGQHNGFSTREIRDLRRLIEDEVAKRKQAR